ncbi:MAG TPA: type II toxin-antitoxin system VapC family toxin [Oculatellaceae cyanobacterium]
MSELWLDTNILLRLITREPPDQAERALRLAEQAERGEVTLKLSPLVVAEMVYVLSSFYRYSRAEITQVLLPLVSAQGVDLQEADLVVAALESMARANVDFVDAFLAETARRQGEAVVSFDRDFRRLGVAWIEPE